MFRLNELGRVAAWSARFSADEPPLLAGVLFFAVVSDQAIGRWTGVGINRRLHRSTERGKAWQAFEAARPLHPDSAQVDAA